MKITSEFRLLLYLLLLAYVLYNIYHLNKIKKHLEIKREIHEVLHSDKFKVKGRFD